MDRDRLMYDLACSSVGCSKLLDALKDQAYRDADELQKCAQDNPGDTSKVKAMARDMLNSASNQHEKLLNPWLVNPLQHNRM